MNTGPQDSSDVIIDLEFSYRSIHFFYKQPHFRVEPRVEPGRKLVPCTSLDMDVVSTSVVDVDWTSKSDAFLTMTRPSVDIFSLIELMKLT